MPILSEFQAQQMDETLEKVMNTRLRLTKIDEQELDESSDGEIEQKKVSSKYFPPVIFKEHFLSHSIEDIRNLAPLPLLNTDMFESKHSPYKQIKTAKRTTVNLLFTLINQDERRSAYYASGQILSPSIEKNILKVCNHKVAQEYLRKVNVTGGILYQCSQISVHGTQYKVGKYVILPQSTNSHPLFGKISMLLCCEEFCYLMCQRTSASYCSDTDLYIVKELQDFDIFPAHHLADFHPLEGYEVGEGKEISLSMRNYILENSAI